MISIGADVPFCYYGKSATIKGIGEQIEFVNHELCDYYVLLVNPLEEVSTKNVFEKCDTSIFQFVLNHAF